MKKIQLLLVAVLLTMVSSSFAQVQFALGLKGGPNFNKLDVNSDVAANYSNRTGFHGGAFAMVKLTKFAIQPEVLFSRQGSKFSFNAQNLETNFDYINVPVMLKLYTVAGLNLQIGPQFGFLSKAGGDVINNLSTVVPAAKDLYKKSDLSLAVGLGWDLPFGLMVEARYNLGLQAIQNNPLLDATKNQVIQVSLGYKLIKIGG